MRCACCPVRGAVLGAECVSRMDSCARTASQLLGRRRSILAADVQRVSHEAQALGTSHQALGTSARGTAPSTPHLAPGTVRVPPARPASCKRGGHALPPRLPRPRALRGRAACAHHADCSQRGARVARLVRARRGGGRGSSPSVGGARLWVGRRRVQRVLALGCARRRSSPRTAASGAARPGALRWRHPTQRRPGRGRVGGRQRRAAPAGRSPVCWHGRSTARRPRR